MNNLRKWEKYKEWEIDYLYDALNEGKSSLQIARKLKRSHVGVVGKIRKLAAQGVLRADHIRHDKVRFPTKFSRKKVRGKPRWTDSDIRKLKKMIHRKLSHVEIATRMGRTVQAVTSRIKMYRDLYGTKEWGTPWSTTSSAHSRKIEKLYAKGWSISDIASELNIPYQAVYYRTAGRYSRITR